MPFDPLFWREAERDDSLNAWNVPKDAARQRANEAAPGTGDIQGFIVALPINWTYREDSLMIKTHLALLAQNGQGVPRVTNANANAFASATPIDASMEA